MSSIHFALKLACTALLGCVGILLLLAAAGISPIPDALRLSSIDGQDKFTRGAALLRLPLPLFLALLGGCKVTAAAGFWGSRGVDELVTLLAALMYVCVGIGHYFVDGGFGAPLLPAALCLAKHFFTPAPVVKSTHSRL